MGWFRVELLSIAVLECCVLAGSLTLVVGGLLAADAGEPGDAGLLPVGGVFGGWSGYIDKIASETHFLSVAFLAVLFALLKWYSPVGKFYNHLSSELDKMKSEQERLLRTIEEKQVEIDKLKAGEDDLS